MPRLCGLLLALTLLWLAPARQADASTTSDSPISAAILAGEYLVRNQLLDGTFQVRKAGMVDVEATTEPRRQAITCYALLRLYRVTRDARFLRAAERGLTPLFLQLEAGEGSSVNALLDSSGEPSVTGSAALLLALTEYYELTGKISHRHTMRALARFLLDQQALNGQIPKTPKSAEGVRVAHPPTGIAVLALARLGDSDQTGPWRESARRAAVWQMAIEDLGRSVDDLPKDEWLVLGLAHLYEHEAWGRRFYIHARRVTTGLLRDRDEWAPRSPVCVTAARTAHAVAKLHQLAKPAGEAPALYGTALAELRTELFACQRAGGGVRQRPETDEITLPAVYHTILALIEPASSSR